MRDPPLLSNINLRSETTDHGVMGGLTFTQLGHTFVLCCSRTVKIHSSMYYCTHNHIGTHVSDAVESLAAEEVMLIRFGC